MTREQRHGDEPVVEVAARVDAPRQHVWDAIVRAELRSQWWSYLTLDAHPGGRFEERWMDDSGEPKVTTGRVIELSEPRLIRLSWSDEDWPAATEVTIELQPTEGVTTVRVTHTGWDHVPGGPGLAQAHGGGWRAHLRNLRAFLNPR